MTPYVVLAFAVPLVAGVLVALPRLRSSAVARPVAIAAAAVSVLSLAAAIALYSPEKQAFQHLVTFGPVAFGGDGIGLALLLSLAVVALLAFFLPVERLPRAPKDEGTSDRACGAMLALLGLASAAIASSHLLVMAGLWLLSAIPAARLQARLGGLRHLEAATKTLVMGVLGAVALAVAAYLASRAIVRPGEEATFDLVELATRVRIADPAAGKLVPASTARWIFGLLVFAAATRLPAVPLHGWFSSLAMESPGPVAVLVGAAFPAMGAALALRVILPLCPDAMLAASPYLLSFGVLQLAWAALLAVSHRDASRVAAAALLVPPALLVLGLGSLNALGIMGSAIAAVSQPLAATLVLGTVTTLHARAGHRHVEGFGGLATKAPRLSALWLAAVLVCGAAPATPLFAALVSTFGGAFPLGATRIVLATTALLGLLAALLWAWQRVFLGPFNERGRTFPDLSRSHARALGAALLLCVVLGLWPQPLARLVGPSLARVVGAAAQR